MSNAQAYFNQTKTGVSAWWSWLIGCWFTIVIGMAVGGVLGIPMVLIMMIKNPEAINAYFELSQGQQALMADDIKFASKLCVLFTILGSGAWLIHRLTRGGLRKAFAWISGLVILAAVVTGIKAYPGLNDAESNAAFMSMIGDSALVYALMLLSFPAFLIGLYLCQRFVHKRTLTSLHTAASKISWSRIFFAIGVTWAVLGTLSVIMHVTGLSPLRATFEPSRFFAFALATLLFIPLQSATEEILFRGYFNQGLGHFISNKWVVFIITSVMFAAMHLSNPESLSGAEKGGFTHLLVMSQYFLFGFILCIIVYFEGGLEAAIGVHAGNNMFAAMFVNYEGSVLPTPSLYIATPNPQSDAIGTIAVLAIIAAILYKTRRRNIAAG